MITKYPSLQKDLEFLTAAAVLRIVLTRPPPWAPLPFYNNLDFYGTNLNTIFPWKKVQS